MQPIPDIGHVSDRESAELNLLACRDVRKADAIRPRDLGEGPDLGSVRDAIRDAHAHHEPARRLAAEKHAGPLQTLAIAFVDRLPSVLCQPRDVGQDVEPVFLALELLDLVQG